MKILVLAEAYPSQTNFYKGAFIHSRLIEYIKEDIEVNVLSFDTNSSYSFEGINVINEESFDSFEKYDLVISHAPNLRNHMRFLLKYNYKKVMFFFHGHEVLIKHNYYPKAYSYVKTKFLKKFINILYDNLKVKIINYWFKSLLKKNKIEMVFVSDWMCEHFEKNIKLSVKKLTTTHIINNLINKNFLKNCYDPDCEKLADFVTIRPLDDSKYGIDLVVQLASKYKEKSFHIYGRGEFFKHVKKPTNIKVFDQFVLQKDIPELLNNYKAALMPTRLDAQGVMACEMASYGIPLITSDISICREMFRDFTNVSYIDNNKPAIDFEKLKPSKNNFKFSTDHTVRKELEVIKASISNG